MLFPIYNDGYEGTTRQYATRLLDYAGRPFADPLEYTRNFVKMMQFKIDLKERFNEAITKEAQREIVYALSAADTEELIDTEERKNEALKAGFVCPLEQAESVKAAPPVKPTDENPIVVRIDHEKTMTVVVDGATVATTESQLRALLSAQYHINDVRITKAGKDLDEELSLGAQGVGGHLCPVDAIARMRGGMPPQQKRSAASQKRVDRADADNKKQKAAVDAFLANPEGECDEDENEDEEKKKHAEILDNRRRQVHTLAEDREIDLHKQRVNLLHAMTHHELTDITRSSVSQQLDFLTSIYNLHVLNDEESGELAPVLKRIGCRDRDELLDMIMPHVIEMDLYRRLQKPVCDMDDATKKEHDLIQQATSTKRKLTLARLWKVLNPDMSERQLADTLPWAHGDVSRLPLFILQDPRVGKTGATLILMFLAWRMKMATCFGGAPDKNTALIQFQQKLDKLRMDVGKICIPATTLGAKKLCNERERNDLVTGGAGDMPNHFTYAYECMHDCAAAARFCERQANNKVAVVKFFDEAHLLAKDLADKCMQELGELLTNKGGPVVLITATMWGAFEAQPVFGTTTFESPLSTEGRLPPAAVPPLMPQTDMHAGMNNVACIGYATGPGAHFTAKKVLEQMGVEKVLLHNDECRIWEVKTAKQQALVEKHTAAVSANAIHTPLHDKALKAQKKAQKKLDLYRVALQQKEASRAERLVDNEDGTWRFEPNKKLLVTMTKCARTPYFRKERLLHRDPADFMELAKCTCWLRQLMLNNNLEQINDLLYVNKMTMVAATDRVNDNDGTNGGGMAQFANRIADIGIEMHKQLVIPIYTSALAKDDIPVLMPGCTVAQGYKRDHAVRVLATRFVPQPKGATPKCVKIPVQSFAQIDHVFDALHNGCGKVKKGEVKFEVSRAEDRADVRIFIVGHKMMRAMLNLNYYNEDLHIGRFDPDDVSMSERYQHLAAGSGSETGDDDDDNNFKRVFYTCGSALICYNGEKAIDMLYQLVGRTFCDFAAVVSGVVPGLAAYAKKHQIVCLWGENSNKKLQLYANAERVMRDAFRDGKAINVAFAEASKAIEGCKDGAVGVDMMRLFVGLRAKRVDTSVVLKTDYHLDTDEEANVSMLDAAQLTDKVVSTHHAAGASSVGPSRSSAGRGDGNASDSSYNSDDEEETTKDTDKAWRRIKGAKKLNAKQIDALFLLVASEYKIPLEEMIAKWRVCSERDYRKEHSKKTGDPNVFNAKVTAHVKTWEGRLRVGIALRRACVDKGHTVVGFDPTDFFSHSTVWENSAKDGLWYTIYVNGWAGTDNNDQVHSHKENGKTRKQFKRVFDEFSRIHYGL